MIKSIIQFNDVVVIKHNVPLSELLRLKHVSFTTPGRLYVWTEEGWIGYFDEGPHYERFIEYNVDKKDFEPGLF